MRSRSTARLRRLGAPLLAGGILGMLFKFADETPGWAWLSDLSSTAALFVVIAAVIGHRSFRMHRAALSAGLLFLATIAGYGLLAVVVPGYATAPFAVGWLALAGVVGTPLAAAFCWSRRRRGIRGGVVPAAGVVIVLAGGYLRRLVVLGLPVLPYDLVQTCFEVVMAAGVGLLATGIRARLWMLGLAIPLTVIAIRLTSSAPLSIASSIGSIAPPG